MKKRDEILLLGAHMSIADGIEKSITRGESIGCTAIQIFTKSNRQWSAKEITDESAKLFKETYNNSSIKSVIVHASYLINIGSESEITNKKSIKALSEELDRCEILDLPYLVLHPGSRQNTKEEDCLNRIANGINEIFSQDTGKTTLLLENMAGMGTSVGHKFEQLAKIYEQIEQKKRIGICFDTCHAFAAGYDFRIKKGYEDMWKEFDDILGLKLLKAMHINDCTKECGSKVDRHAHIGKGQINTEAFKLLFNDERFLDIPKVLETPIKKEIEEYIPDLKVIVNLLTQNNKKLVKNTRLEEYLR